MVITDLREQKRRHAEETWLQLAAIVESSQDAIIGKSLDGKIVSWNLGAEGIYGYSADEAIGQPISILLPPGRADEWPAIKVRIRRGEKVEHYETKRRRKDGTVIDVSLGVSPIKTPDGEIVGAAAVSRDITERKQAAEIKQAEAMHRLLLDAPSSVQPPIPTEKFHPFGNEQGPPLTLGAVGISSGAMPGTELGHVTPGPQPGFTGPYQVAFIQKESNGFLGMYLYPPSLKTDTSYYPSSSDSFMGRASYAASRIFVTRDNSGKGRLNTRYFLGVLSSVAMHAAYRPYRTRSNSETFNNFGSTIGGDTGINIFHEFRPGIRQMVKGLTPKFVSRIGERITHDQMQRDIISIPAR